MIRIPRFEPDKREVGGSAARAFGVLATLNGAANPPGPIEGSDKAA